MELSLEVIAFLMAVAFMAGTIDAMAGGGGLLTIPALLAVGVPPVAAIATNKLQSAMGTTGTVIAFARKGHIDFRRFALPAFCAFVGSACGAWLLQRLDPSFLGGIIPALLIAMAAYFVLAPRMSEEDRHQRIGPFAVAGVIAVIGMYDGFFGPGTGSFMTTALVALGGLGVVRATAQTKYFNLASNLAALAVMISGGHILWTVGLAMAVANILGGQVGAHAAMRFGGRAVRPVLVTICLALTVKLLSDPGNPLRVAVLQFVAGWST
ncbi:TSUP family transporter [Lysobacter tyrosinilyticus]